MSTDIEQRLQRAFAAYADAAGDGGPADVGSEFSPSVPLGDRRGVRRWRAPVALGTAVAAAAAGVFLVVGLVGDEGSPSAGQAAAATWEAPEYTDPGDRAEAAEAFLRLLRGRQEVADYAPAPYQSLAEALPNTQFEAPGGSLWAATELVVVGRITEVSPGRGFYVPPGGDEPDVVETTFDDPRDLMWQTVHARVEVTSVLGGEPSTRTVVVGFAWGQSIPFEVAREGLPALGELVLFLSPSAVFDYEPGIYGVERDGALLITVGADGRLTLPVLDPTEAERLLAGTPTLDSLREAAAAPPRVLPVPVPE